MATTESNLRAELEKMGLRQELEAPKTLSSGLKSQVFWRVEELRRHKLIEVQKSLRPWLDQIRELEPKSVIGIPSGGRTLSSIISRTLLPTVRNLHCKRVAYPLRYNRAQFTCLVNQEYLPCILIDDVLTTGATVRITLHQYGVLWDDKIYTQFKAVAVLVNRNGMTEIEGIPIISGIFADPVEPSK